VAIDFEAEGLLEGAADERARRARLELLRTLEDEGFTLDELRAAAAEDRLALLPVERVLEGEGPRHTQREIAELTGLELDFLRQARRALGAPAVEPDARELTEEDLELSRSAAALIAAGLPRDDFLELTRVMSQAMSGVAATFASIWGAALMRPGDTERDVGLRYAESLRELGPLAGPTLGHMLNLRMREQVRQAVVGEAELRSGRLPGSQPIVVAFVDIVGFTRLGEQVAPEELGPVVRTFEENVEAVVRPPVRLVKTIGDAAMLVAPRARPVVDATLELVTAAAREMPELRGGIAAGDALPRAGDWYGRPVNLAARLTSFARRRSVVASGEVRELAGDDGYAWSSAGRRRFKGVKGEIDVFRVRRTAP